MPKTTGLTTPLLAGALVGAALFAASPAGAYPDGVVYGVRDGATLVTFSPSNPGAAVAAPVVGLQPGDRLLGIDLRPVDNTVWGVGASGTLYTVTVGNGGTTAMATPGPRLTLNTDGSAVVPVGAAFGVDFNPAADLLRVVSDTGQDLRIVVADRPSTATAAPGAKAGTTFYDGALKYAAPGDPADAMSPPTPVTAADVNAGKLPRATAAAYSDNVAGTATTKLFVVDSAAGVVVLQNPPNAGILNTVGPLGVPADGPSAFDIDAAGNAYGAFGSTLYRIDVGTGAATVVGPIGGGGLDGMTVLSAA
ncbi:MAG: DUF4394 domain-containing protein [Mycobacterium sp.]